jgi:hypothetical protein
MAWSLGEERISPVVLSIHCFSTSLPMTRTVIPFPPARWVNFYRKKGQFPAGNNTADRSRFAYSIVLKAADVGIALGTGVDVAQEATGAVLLSPSGSLEAIPELIAGSDTHDLPSAFP